MDTLTLKSLQLEGKHGVYQEEKEQGNRFELDVIVRGEFRQAAERDDLSFAADYRLIEEAAAEVMAGPSRDLIERLCAEIGERILAKMPNIRYLELALRKIAPPLKHPVAYAEIRMQWQT